MHTASDNKRLVQHLYAELAKGNGQPFADAMADDFCWHLMGRTAWSGTWRGKPYHNHYCMVIRLQDGLMKELTEYLDTALVDERHALLQAHRDRVETDLADLQQALALLDRKIGFYGEWMSTGQRPPELPSDANGKRRRPARR